MYRCVGNKRCQEHTHNYMQKKTRTSRFSTTEFFIVEIYYDYILDEIMHCDHVELERKIQED